MKEREALKLALEALKNNKRTHYYCEDTWYSCPQHEDGCANDSKGDECNCGADKANAEIDQAITAIEEVLAQPEHEPVEILKLMMEESAWEGRIELSDVLLNIEQFYITPPQRTWVKLTDEEVNELVEQTECEDYYGLVEATEAKLKEKNT